MAYVKHQGVRIYFRVIGSGPPLVLHHGFTQSLKRWYLCGYVAALRKDFRLILMDPRGHGGSDKPYDPAAYDFSLRIGDVIAVLDELDVERAAFWGYSTGGRIAFGLAKHARERVTALIIGGHDPYERRIPESARAVSHDPQKFLDSLLERINLDPRGVSPERRDELLDNDWKALAAAQQDEPSIEDVLPTMTMPCLVYAGGEDPFFERIEKSARLIPDVAFHSFPGLSHSGMFWASDLIVPRVREFLESAFAAETEH